MVSKLSQSISLLDKTPPEPLLESIAEGLERLRSPETAGNLVQRLEICLDKQFLYLTMEETQEQLDNLKSRFSQPGNAALRERIDTLRLAVAQWGESLKQDRNFEPPYLAGEMPFHCESIISHQEVGRYLLHADNARANVLWLLISNGTSPGRIPIILDCHAKTFSLKRRGKDNKVEVETFESLENLLKHLRNKGVLSEPAILSPEDCSPAAEEDLKLMPFLPELSEAQAIAFLRRRKEGTHVILEQADAFRQRKLLWTSSDMSVESRDILPTKFPVKGYLCAGDWYPSIQAILRTGKSKGTLTQGLSLYPDELETLYGHHRNCEGAKLDLPPADLSTTVPDLSELSQFFITPDLRDAWTKAIAKLDSKQKKEVLTAVSDLQTLSVLPSFLNTLSAAQLRGTALTELLPKQQDQRAIEWALEQTAFFRSLEQHAKTWSDPKFTQSHLPLLRDEIEQRLNSMESEGGFLPELFSQSETAGRLCVIGVLQTATCAVQEVAKAVEQSDLYPQDGQLRAEHFTRLLHPWAKVLASVLPLIPANEEEELMSNKWGNPGLSFSELVHLIYFGYSSGYKPWMRGGVAGRLRDLFRKIADPQLELTCRDHFWYPSLLIGSHNDPSYGVIWPKRSKEMAIAIHENILRVKEYLYAREALPAQVTEGGMQQIQNLVEKLFPSHTLTGSLDGQCLRLNYHIPLRQHTCAIQVEYDIQHPEKGILLTGIGQGTQEHFRWAQLASFGALLGSTGHFTIPEASQPKIHYPNPLGCAFSLKLPPSLSPQQSRYLEKGLRITLSDISFHEEGESRVQTWLESLVPKRNWTALDERFWEQSLHFSIPLMKNFSFLGQPGLAAKAATGALKGLINYGLSDYLKRTGLGEELEGSLKEEAERTLIDQMKHNPNAVEPLLREFLQLPEIAQHFPEIHSRLRHLLPKALLSKSPPRQ